MTNDKRNKNLPVTDRFPHTESLFRIGGNVIEAQLYIATLKSVLKEGDE